MFCSTWNVTPDTTWKLLCDKINLSHDKNVDLPDASTCRATSFENACDLPTSACDKVRLVRVWRQNHILCHVLNKARTGIFRYVYSQGILQLTISERGRRRRWVLIVKKKFYLKQQKSTETCRLMDLEAIWTMQYCRIRHTSNRDCLSFLPISHLLWETPEFINGSNLNSFLFSKYLQISSVIFFKERHFAGNELEK